MKCSLESQDLINFISNQLAFFSCDDSDREAIRVNLPTALARLEECFKNVAIRNYKIDGEVFFNHLHSDQYSQFLYFLGNTIWKSGGNEVVCQKLMNLNRMLSGMFVSYKCNLPRIFLFCHAVGTVVGNAEYDDYLVIFQNVTINTSDSRGDNLPPRIGRGVFLSAGSKIIGSPKIGDHVSIGVNSQIYNIDIPDDYISVNINGETMLKKRKRNTCHAQSYFDCDI